MLKSLIACLKRLLGLGPKSATPQADTAPQSPPPLGATAPPPEPTQPSPFAIPSYIAPSGEYPTPEGGISIMFTLAMIHSAVGTQGQPSFNVLPADGRQLSAEIGTNAPLYSIILNQFGGEAPNFALPDLRGRAVIGTTPVATTPAHSVQMMWLMATQSLPPFEGLAGIAAGMVIPFAGTAAPYGWVSCDGSLFTQAQYPQLYALFGNAFGWLPGGQVALPRLADTMVVGAGAPYAPGWPNTVVGTTIQGPVPGLCLNYLICWKGIWPYGGNPQTPIPAEQGFVGQIIAYAGSEPPQGWLFCDGALLAIETYQELFVMLETTYGGDGETNFAVPDLRGKMLVGPS